MKANWKNLVAATGFAALSIAGMVVCAVVVTAGRAVSIGAENPAEANLVRLGVSVPRWSGVRPTQQMTASRFIGRSRSRQAS